MLKPGSMLHCCKQLLLVLALSSLWGCVTTTESVFTDEASPEKALQRRVELARNYIGEGNWEDAKRNLKQAAAIDPKNPGVHEAFALVYQSTGEYELAQESFEIALRSDPSLSRARNNYAAFLYSQKQYEQAERELEIVTKDTLYTSRPSAFVNLGLCRVQLDKPEQAKQAFERALTMDRTNRIALLEMAKLHFEAEDFDSAERYYGVYRTLVKRQTAAGLWLGIRIAQARGDRNAEGSFVLALQNMYPDSPQWKAYQRTLSP